MENKEIISKIKHQLGYSRVLIEWLMEEGINRNNIPIEFFEDAVKSYRRIVRLLNKIKS